jgi:hypothetical protein
MPASSRRTHVQCTGATAAEALTDDHGAPHRQHSPRPSRAVWLGDRPLRTRVSAACNLASPRAGRPGSTAAPRAAAIPSRVHSTMRRRSKWAIAPNTWKASSPAAEDVSRRSSSERNPRPRALKSSTVAKQFLSERPSRPGARRTPRHPAALLGQRRDRLPDRASEQRGCRGRSGSGKEATAGRRGQRSHVVRDGTQPAEPAGRS